MAVARKHFFWLSIVSNFGMLGFFKYFNFFVDNVHRALAAVGPAPSLPALRVLLPVGISFYTFQAMSYTIDVYRGELRARRSCSTSRCSSRSFPTSLPGPFSARRSFCRRWKGRGGSRCERGTGFS